MRVVLLLLLLFLNQHRSFFCIVWLRVYKIHFPFKPRILMRDFPAFEETCDISFFFFLYWNGRLNLSQSNAYHIKSWLLIREKKLDSVSTSANQGNA